MSDATREIQTPVESIAELYRRIRDLELRPRPGAAGVAPGYYVGSPLLLSASGNFVKSLYPGLAGIGLEIQAPGGAGGGAPASTAGNVSFGGGGGAGGWGRKLFVAADLLPSIIPYAVGAPGVGVSGADGNPGGSVEFGTSSATPTSPTVRSVGAVVQGALPLGAPGAPAGYATGDLLLLFIEDAGNATPSVITGYTHHPASPRFYDSPSTQDSRIQVMYRIATGVSSEDIPTSVPGLSDHGNARIMAIQAGTFDASDPFDTYASADTPASTTPTFPSITTTNPDTLVVLAGSNHWSDAWASWTNANLSALTEQIDNTTTAASRGSLGVATGLKASAGATGTTTATLAGAQYSAGITFGINRNPDLGSEPANSILCRATGGLGGTTLAAATTGTARTGIIGGGPGIGTHGDILARGGRGGDIYQTTGGSVGGTPNGGQSHYGQGGQVVLETNGQNSESPGGGGGGMRNNGAVAARIGGTGGIGLILVTLYY